MKISKFLGGIIFILLLVSTPILAGEGGMAGREILIDECEANAGYYFSVDNNFLTAAAIWGLTGEFGEVERMMNEKKIVKIEKDVEVNVLRCTEPEHTFVGNIPVIVGPYCRVSFVEEPDKSPVWIYVEGLSCGKSDPRLPKKCYREDKSKGI